MLLLASGLLPGLLLQAKRVRWQSICTSYISPVVSSHWLMIELCAFIVPSIVLILLLSVTDD